MDAAYDWLNVITAIFLGKAGGIAGALAIVGIFVAIGLAIYQSEGFARVAGIVLVIVSIAFAGWMFVRPDHYRTFGQYGFAVEMPASFSIVGWSADRVTLSGGSGLNRVVLHTGTVPPGPAGDYLEMRRARMLKYAQEHNGSLGVNDAGNGFVFVRWIEQGQPDEPDTVDHFAGLVLKRDGDAMRWASLLVVMQVHGNPLRGRDYLRMRQSLCASAGLILSECAPGR